MNWNCEKLFDGLLCQGNAWPWHNYHGHLHPWGRWWQRPAGLGAEPVPKRAPCPPGPPPLPAPVSVVSRLSWTNAKQAHSCPGPANVQDSRRAALFPRTVICVRTKGTKQKADQPWNKMGQRQGTGWMISFKEIRLNTKANTGTLSLFLSSPFFFFFYQFRPWT